jgi:hypothetical protein
MADGTVDLGATDIWGLTTTAGFHAQSSSTDPFSSEEVSLASDGDMACTNEHDKGNDYSTTYKYCGTGIVASLGAKLTSFGGVVGTGAAAKIPTGISFSFSPGGQAEITITGHNHQTNNHSASTNAPNVFDVSGLIPAAAGIGIPALIVAAGEAGGTASRNGASLDISMNHIDKEGNDGHFIGESITCRADLSVDYEGVAGTTTAGSWLQILQAVADDNENPDTSSVTAHQFIDAT